jgi:hypothetical protein
MKADRRWLACISGALILGGVYVDHSTLHALSKNAEGYHARIREVADQLPRSAGDWLGSKTEVPAGAVGLLRPNVTLSLDFTNTAGQRASFLLVQCRDARDLLGHYPPVCYDAHGFVLVKHEPRTWDVDGDQLQGTMYEFSRTDRQDRVNSIKVYDVMILPNGQTAPDMAGVDRVARHREQRYYGAAQIQILTDAALPEEKRTEVIGLLLRGAKPVINAIRAGVPHES